MGNVAAAGDREQLPLTILSAVLKRARSMGYPVASDDLFLLALTELPEGTPASDVLAAQGLDAARAETEITSQARAKPDETAVVSFPPAYNEMLGRAEGFAATLGDGTITPEQVLMSLMWDPTSLSSTLLWRLGVGREAVMEGLRERDVPIPQTQIPAQIEVEVGPRVWVNRDDLRTLMAKLPRKLGRDARLGFNYRDDRAWVVAEASVDLQAAVDEVLADAAS